MVRRTDARGKRNHKRTQTVTGIDDPALQQVQLLRAKDVAALCAVDASTVWRWAARVNNALPVVRIGKRCSRFKLADLKTFIEGAMDG